MISALDSLRYLLWREKPDPKDWTDLLYQWIGGDRLRVRELLAGRTALTGSEMEAISQATHEPLDDIPHQTIPPEILYRENVCYLLRDLSHGDRQRLAAEVEVSENTLARWSNRRVTPERKHLKRIAKAFVVLAKYDLTRDPIFLWTEQTSDLQRRKWLARRSREVDAERLAEIFPALKRLLGEGSDEF